MRYEIRDINPPAGVRAAMELQARNPNPSVAASQMYFMPPWAPRSQAINASAQHGAARDASTLARSRSLRGFAVRQLRGRP